MKAIQTLLAIWAVSGIGWAATPAQQSVLQQLQRPVGFNISIFADQVPNARSLALGDHGVVYVGTQKPGVVYAVQDQDGDGKAERRWIVAENLYIPNGVAFKDGSLFVAEVNRILRFDRIGEKLDNPPQPTVIFDQLPSDKHHGWKYLRFGPDGKLYTAVGSPCNICDPAQAVYTSLLRIDADGKNMEILARGIRNTVGFDWQPGSQQLYFTENGRDHLGDDLPPDELNKWTTKGQHFGYPYCHGGEIADPEFSGEKNCGNTTAPAWKFKAHMAPLGMRFYTGSQFPERFRNQLFVAQHGSWNRSQPHGYRVALVKFDKQGPVSEQSFISGWLNDDGTASGRPVDVLQMADGSLLISDDLLGVIYRVTYQP